MCWPEHCSLTVSWREAEKLDMDAEKTEALYNWQLKKKYNYFYFIHILHKNN